jgi:plasmid stabilization system protein ParE
MRVRWNKQSKEQLIRTASYIRHEFGQDIMDEFMAEVKRTNKLLARNPHIGIVEPLLSDIPIEYRSIVFSNINKIVYHIVGKHIEVIALWDTRREPTKQIEQTIQKLPD